ncbi:MAG: thioredoxin-disulfide reductase [bacterium]|nr:thioredoxin-disulfide reductase [bacterium]
MSIYDTIIIGGGPAGLSAGLYAARAGLRSLLLEKSFLGGQAITADRIENYPGFPEPISGLKIIQNMEEQARKYNLAIVVREVKSLEAEEGKFRIYLEGGLEGKLEPELENKLENGPENGGLLLSRTVIVATGASPIRLNVPGEVEFTGRGVSYCATCDGPLFRDREVVVVGGGNSAVEEALFLAKFARKVTIVHRRSALRADKILQDRAFQNPKIHFLWNSVVQEIKGDSQVRAVSLQDLTSRSLTTQPTDGLFIYVGSKPNTAWLPPAVKLDDKGFIITDERLSSSLAGLFAAGDCRQKPLRQIITAASDGALAGMMAYHYLQEKT